MKLKVLNAFDDYAVDDEVNVIGFNGAPVLQYWKDKLTAGDVEVVATPAPHTPPE